MQLDHQFALYLIPLAIWVLASGLDDLFITLVHYCFGRRRLRWPESSLVEQAPERRIAVFVPLWREHRVIGQMLDHNLSTISYRNYEVFVGVYPNDGPTGLAVAEAARRNPRVHVVAGVRDGPTSKADCLNSIYRGMQDYEARHGDRFEIVVTHDAEDLVHQESLRLINWYSRHYDMVQVPVLPLPIGFREWTHGLYCDEFAEYQLKDIPVRQRLGGFLPSNGVGTGFARAALERLPGADEGRIFDPECLTEDYETGCLLHALGCRQIFVPVRFDAADFMATREYFPRKFWAAVRQRSRWVTGIGLQGWQRHGWRGPWRQVYWFWRDRKGLAGNLLSPATNLLLVCLGLGYLSGAAKGATWNLVSHVPRWMVLATVALSCVQMGVRAHLSASIYGWRFAWGVPLRMFWGNLVNSLATAAALRQLLSSRIRRRSLVWRKTEHVYPSLCAPEAESSGILTPV